MAVCGPAAAEGGWDSTITARPSYGSRTWVDKNVDSTNAYVKLYVCNQRGAVAIFRNRQWPVPDVTVKDTTWSCDNGIYYGDTAAGDYHFTLKKTSNGGVLDANVQVRY
ncbi:hypothetical protein VV01_21920 [Luteipulveratus halotolerans]|uniref:Uncharacterized protein n=2 Tax=Luteipulveratus halotolerans TaxID=1631356 RepID=A0A0L6CDF0_9MICO|nr:hypothetical protein VV01_21920 [Luteipulveratus halotolerans]